MYMFGKKLIPLLFATPPARLSTTTTLTTTTTTISTFQPNAIPNNNCGSSVAFQRSTEVVVLNAQQDDNDVDVAMVSDSVVETTEDEVEDEAEADADADADADAAASFGMDNQAEEKTVVEETEAGAAAVSPPRKIINDVMSLYGDLAAGCFSTMDHYHPMIQFKYMSPTNIRGSTNFLMDENISDDASKTTTTDGLDQVFEQIRGQSQTERDSEDKNTNEKTIAIYLPGLDGVGISATT
eukprot:CAMPEP_0203683976 /NCGR_PEP_ID=MMETSP0090-20130426/47802_1 /ASSEMBLY_ACC=CAM_ASM_001088 /TAXON_ID=426623 /ORGANISM="Chaetoceros affinis, Strain CCMP159" /LENGTH=239 /DNA_ID=CAMNT_0050553137 /DNA_START=27 /DNA_END=743 /DNA_ORIENTATION=-